MTEEQVIATLEKLGANSEDTAKTVDEIFKAGTLTFGLVNSGILALEEKGKIKRIEKGGFGRYYLA